MLFADTYKVFKGFYTKCDKPTFWFCLIELYQVLGFMPSLPSPVLYAAIACYALYQLFRKDIVIDRLLLVFLIYVPISLLIVSPDSVFNSWKRYVLFVLLLISVSPLLSGGEISRNRKIMLKMMLFLCVFIGVGSFFAKFLGLNFAKGIPEELLTRNGFFAGLTIHALPLGAISGIGAIYMAYLAYTTKKKVYLLLSILCVMCVMFSASRIAFISLVIGFIVMLFRLSESAKKFAINVGVLILIGGVSYPIWSGAMDCVIHKNEFNIRAGSMFKSREKMWNSRIEEFCKSPVFGVGFAAIDREISEDFGFHKETGNVEPGSSWLIIFSMTGLLGAMLIIPVLIKAYYKTFRRKTRYACFLCGLLTFFFVHMIAEGYIYFGGSQLAFMLWLTIGVAMDCSYLKSNFSGKESV